VQPAAATSGDLSRLLDPKVIAIAGLSADVTKHGARVLTNLRRHGFGGEVYGVNPGLPEIEGVEVFPAVGEIPVPPDLVVASVPAPTAVEVVSDCSGVGGVVVFAAGFAESGDEGATLQGQLVEAAARAGTRVVGPNSGGIIRPARGLTASFLTCLDRPRDQLRSGPVAVVTQSGGTGSYLHNLAAGRGEGIAISVSTGNEADVRLGEAIGAVSILDEVEAIVVLVETVRDGEAFIEAARGVHARGQRLVACRLGRSRRAGEIMTSHTGALALPERLLDGMFAGLGVAVAETPAEAYEMASMLAGQTPTRGGRAGVVTHSGGAAILLADLAERAGVALPPPSSKLAGNLSGLLDHGSISNPLDMGGIIGGPGRFADVIEAMAGSGEYDAVLAVSTAHPPQHTAQRVDALLGLEARIPVLHLWMAGDVAVGGLERLRSAGRPVTEEPRAAIGALAGLFAAPAEWPGSGPCQEGPSLDWALPIDPGLAAPTADDAVAAASRVGYPVVVKIDVSGLDHKTDVDGVLLDLRHPNEVRSAFDAVVAAAEGEGLAPVGVRVQRFRPGLELIVGGMRHESFGPVISVGAGGVLTEALGDVTFRPAPVGLAGARAMIDSLAIRPLLDGYRGSAPADIAELARIVSVVSHTVTRRGDVTEMEINPLIWDGEEWVGVDWLMAGEGSGPASGLESARENE
jgi:acyl-CoA synthetase (NDP forming)